MCTAIKDFLHAFSGSTPQISCESKIIDLLSSHRWNTSGFDDFWFRSENAVFVPRSETVRTAAALPPASPHRTTTMNTIRRDLIRCTLSCPPLTSCRAFMMVIG